MQVNQCAILFPQSHCARIGGILQKQRRVTGRLSRLTETVRLFCLSNKAVTVHPYTKCSKKDLQNKTFDIVCIKIILESCPVWTLLKWRACPGQCLYIYQQSPQAIIRLYLLSGGPWRSLRCMCEMRYWIFVWACTEW